MLFNNNGASPANPDSRQHSLTLCINPSGHASSRPTAASPPAATRETNRDSSNHNGNIANNLPTALLDSPSTCTTSDSVSRLAIETPSTIYSDSSDQWPYMSVQTLTPTREPEHHLLRRHSTDPTDLTKTRPPHRPPRRSSTFTLTVIPSPASTMTEDDIIPKVEEIDDDEALALESGSVRNHSAAAELDPLEAKSLPAPPVSNGPRKRGRPRKHPLPVPGQNKVAKGRSKTGCITCRRRKKKCDETRPSCLNCQKNAVVCEGYPVKEIWKSGKEKIEEGNFAILCSDILRALSLRREEICLSIIH